MGRRVVFVKGLLCVREKSEIEEEEEEIGEKEAWEREVEMLSTHRTGHYSVISGLDRPTTNQS